MPRHAPHAPGELELVRAFVNTLDVEEGVDLLADDTSWRPWAIERGLGGAASTADLRRLRRLRESLRSGLMANHDGAPLPVPTRDELDEALSWSGARATVTERGLALTPRGNGPRRLAAAVVEATTSALTDGTWSRLKACQDDRCRWAFYDHSRSRTGQWCSMEICGNRNKQARWRDRQP